MLSSDQNEDLNLACTILCLYQKRHKISAPGLRCRGLEENSDSICILLGSLQGVLGVFAILGWSQVVYTW